jgi:tRNA-2-methylthio-N6-dimethylallyladenosine synthase
MLYRFPEILYRTMTEQKRIFSLQESPGNIAEGIPVRRESRFQAWVSIMYGCNNFCTYCIVPYVRGRERSRLPEDILAEVKDLVAAGYREITLLGQNVNSYGKDLESDYDFSDLLCDIDALDGDFILRFMTSHPKDASQKLFDVIGKSRHIAHHFHLPLQSGSDRILKLMNRHYSKRDFLQKAVALKKAVPDIALTTDIIVGFPGETEQDFNETLSVLKEVGFDNIYAFLYSPRVGTPAAEMENQIDESVKTERFSKMMNLQNEICHTLSDAYLEQEVRVLVEGRSKNNPEKLTGRTSDNRVVHFTASDDYIGTFQILKITEAHAFALYGELVSQDNI